MYIWYNTDCTFFELQNVLIVAKLHCHKSVCYIAQEIRLGSLVFPCDRVGSVDETSIDHNVNRKAVQMGAFQNPPTFGQYL